MIKISVEKTYRQSYNLVLRVGREPLYTSHADSYYLFDFVCFAGENITDNLLKTLQDGLAALIEFWMDCIGKYKEKKIFLPFDLSDEYVGGLLLVPGDNKVINLFYAYTKKWIGPCINKHNVDVLVNEDNNQFRKDGDCLATLTYKELIGLLRMNINNLASL